MTPVTSITGAMLQITQHAERLALLDQREATHFRETAERLAEHRPHPGRDERQVGDVHDVAARQSALLDTLDGLDQQVAALATRLTAIDRQPGRRGRCGDELPAGPCAPLVEARRTRPRGSPGPAARLGRADLPPRLRPPRRRPRPLLGPAPTLPLRTRLAHGTVVRPLPHPRAQPLQPSPAKPNGKPVSCPPSPSSCYLETTRCQHAPAAQDRRPSHPTDSHDGGRPAHRRPGTSP